jgi:hypothetical protein
MYQRTTNQLDGIGYVLTDGEWVVGIDLDHCRETETGKIADWALAIITRFNTYTEVSPTGEGVHLWLKAHRTRVKGRRKGNVEVYSWGRYLTVTGNHLAETPAELRDDEDVQLILDAFEDEMDRQPGQTFARNDDDDDHDAIDDDTDHDDDESPDAPITDAQERAPAPPGDTFVINLDPDYPPARKLAAWQEIDAKFKATWQRRRKDFGDDQSASVYDLANADFGAKMHLSDQEIVDLCISWRLTHGELDRQKCLRRDYWENFVLAPARRVMGVHEKDAKLEARLDQLLPRAAASTNDPNDPTFQALKDDGFTWFRERYGVRFVKLLCEMSDLGTVGKYIAELDDGSTIEYGPVSNLLTQRKFIEITVDAIGHDMTTLVRVKESVWDRRVRLLIAMREIVRVGPEGNGRAMVIEWLAEYLNTMARPQLVTTTEERSKILRGGVDQGAYREGEYVYFRLDKFAIWLDQHMQIETNRKELGGWLTRKGGKSVVVNFLTTTQEYSTRRTWRIALNTLQEFLI